MGAFNLFNTGLSQQGDLYTTPPVYRSGQEVDHDLVGPEHVEARVVGGDHDQRIDLRQLDPLNSQITVSSRGGTFSGDLLFPENGNGK